jgi:hypothetical protein
MGFVLKGTAPNRKSPSKTVFYFRQSEEIEKVIAEYVSVNSVKV